MTSYPVLQIDTQKIYNNSKIITSLCAQHNITVAGVVKGFDGIPEIAKKVYDGGCKQIASSRIKHIKAIKDAYSEIPTMLIRIPMLSEAVDVVRYCDISLNSEKVTLMKLNDEAKKQHKIHKVILMRDLGDLREGVFSEDELIRLCVFVENELENIELYGIGTNLSCYGSIMPTNKNLTELCNNADAVEKAIGRKLEIVSGGSTTTLPLLVRGGVPDKINHLRVGEAIINANDLPKYWDTHIDGMDNDTFILRAEIVEVNEKPTYPIGEMCVNAYGVCGQYEDRGIRKRAIIGTGNLDVGDCKSLMPKDKNIKILGASSDHTILDIHNSDINYQVGDIVEFNMMYEPMVRCVSSNLVRKEII